MSAHGELLRHRLDYLDLATTGVSAVVALISAAAGAASFTEAACFFGGLVFELNISLNDILNTFLLVH
ncbi:hypothetical protein [Kordiimonas sp.]|uniref:hypothetical protein n=1 Tax=Kordiimonas sp. TaxID=1970157 RepID=UPI003A8D7C09